MQIASTYGGGVTLKSADMMDIKLLPAAVALPVANEELWQRSGLTLRYYPKRLQGVDYVMMLSVGPDPAAVLLGETAGHGELWNYLQGYQMEGEGNPTHRPLPKRIGSLTMRMHQVAAGGSLLCIQYTSEGADSRLAETCLRSHSQYDWLTITFRAMEIVCKEAHAPSRRTRPWLHLAAMPAPYVQFGSYLRLFEVLTEELMTAWRQAWVGTQAASIQSLLEVAEWAYYAYEQAGTDGYEVAVTWTAWFNLSRVISQPNQPAPAVQPVDAVQLIWAFDDSAQEALLYRLEDELTQAQPSQEWMEYLKSGEGWRVMSAPDSPNGGNPASLLVLLNEMGGALLTPTQLRHLQARQDEWPVECSEFPPEPCGRHGTQEQLLRKQEVGRALRRAGKDLKTRFFHYWDIPRILGTYGITPLGMWLEEGSNTRERLDAAAFQAIVLEDHGCRLTALD